MPSQIVIRKRKRVHAHMATILYTSLWRACLLLWSFFVQKEKKFLCFVYFFVPSFLSSSSSSLKESKNMAEGSTLEWSLGFRNRATGKYLTQETFGYTLNCHCEFAGVRIAWAGFFPLSPTRNRLTERNMIFLCTPPHLFHLASQPPL